MPSASVFAADDRSRPRISLSDTLSAPPERISKDASAFIPVSPAPSLPNSELDVRRVKASIFVFTPYPSKERVSRPSETTATESTRFAPAYSAILAADAVNNVDFTESVKKASVFIKECIKRSVEMELPLTDGVCFEECLYKLAR